jgi:hypothetical protein
MRKKTIKINEPTHSNLENLGKKGETFDDIINRLIRMNRMNREGR